MSASATDEQISAVAQTVGTGGPFSRLLLDNADNPLLWFVFGAVSVALVLMSCSLSEIGDRHPGKE